KLMLLFIISLLLTSSSYSIDVLSDLSISKPAGAYSTPVLVQFTISSPNRFMITVNDDPTKEEAKSFPCPFSISNQCSIVIARSTLLNVRVCGDQLSPIDCLYRPDEISAHSYQIVTGIVKPIFESNELPDKFSWKHTFGFKVTNLPQDTEEYSVRTFLEIQGLSIGAFGEVKDGYVDFHHIQRPNCGIGKITTRRSAYLYYSLFPKIQSLDTKEFILRQNYLRFNIIKNQPWTGWIEKFYIHTSGASQAAHCKAEFEGRVFDYNEETSLEVPK
ncbi:hypothetical protein MJH12_16070, partial [bacterium]|nr:hypothetical protein [bacterium]